MAYSELVFFIKEQLGMGRDAKTIRDYLIRRNIDSKSVDAAFDEVFGAKEEEPKGHGEKIVLAGIAVLVFVFIGVGFFYYNQITPVSPVSDNVPSLEPVNELQQKSICNFDDDEAKYQCYAEKFEKDEIFCYEIDDVSERDFCYIAKDMYAMSV
ncbi:MAG: hypothetical protein ABH828_03165 [archaeon]